LADAPTCFNGPQQIGSRTTRPVHQFSPDRLHTSVRRNSGYTPCRWQHRLKLCSKALEFSPGLSGPNVRPKKRRKLSRSHCTKASAETMGQNSLAGTIFQHAGCTHSRDNTLPKLRKPEGQRFTAVTRSWCQSVNGRLRRPILCRDRDLISPKPITSSPGPSAPLEVRISGVATSVRQPFSLPRR